MTSTYHKWQRDDGKSHVMLIISLENHRRLVQQAHEQNLPTAAQLDRILTAYFERRDAMDGVRTSPDEEAALTELVRQH